MITREAILKEINLAHQKDLNVLAIMVSVDDAKEWVSEYGGLMIFGCRVVPREDVRPGQYYVQYVESGMERLQYWPSCGETSPGLKKWSHHARRRPSW